MRFAYGTEEIEVLWPHGDPDIVSYRSPPVGEDRFEGALLRALQSPIASDPLERLAAGRRSAVILVSDMTRLCPTARILPSLLNALNAGGIPDSRIRVIVAIGTHRLQTRDELREIAGDAFGRVEVVNHSAASEDCVLVGTTSLGTPVELNRAAVEAELRIAVGNIEPHRLVGVSGGGKALFPGVASAASIERHHALSRRFAAVPGYTDNPLHRDIEEICRIVPIHFLCNVVVDHRRRLLGAFAGSLTATHRTGAAFAREQFLVPLRRQYDAVVASAGGAPKDMQLYQAIKSLDNASWLAKPGAPLLLIARCEEVYGNAAFQSWTETRADRERTVRELRERFVLGAHKLAQLHAILKKHPVYLYSDIPAAAASLLGVVPIDDVQAWINANVTANLAVAAMPCASLTYLLPGPTLP